jgi:hypothetical protein
MLDDCTGGTGEISRPFWLPEDDPAFHGYPEWRLGGSLWTRILSVSCRIMPGLTLFWEFLEEANDHLSKVRKLST